MEKFILASLWMIRGMGRECISGMMERSIMGSGQMEDNMGLVFIKMLRARLRRDSGKMGKEFNGYESHEMK